MTHAKPAPSSDAALRAEHPGHAVLAGGHSIGGQFAVLAATATRSLQRTRLNAAQLGVPADHFAWMRAPQAIADTLAQWWRAEARPVSP